MKKILMGSMVLTALSLSIIAFQVSCSKTANAQTGSSSGITQQNKIIYHSYDSTFPSQLGIKIWIANYDGSNATQIKVTLPSQDNWNTFPTPVIRLSPDGKTLFMSDGSSIYSVGVGGGILAKIPTSPNTIFLQSVN